VVFSWSNCSKKCMEIWYSPGNQLANTESWWGRMVMVISLMPWIMCQ
jgi:hypothetical protein